MSLSASLWLSRWLCGRDVPSDGDLQRPRRLCLRAPRPGPHRPHPLRLHQRPPRSARVYMRLLLLLTQMTFVRWCVCARGDDEMGSVIEGAASNIKDATIEA
eukprot:2903767-Rhodomonas_salina.1